MEINKNNQIENNENEIKNNNPCCICNKSDKFPIIICHSNIKKCNGAIHPDCFGLTELQINQAINSNDYICPLCDPTSYYYQNNTNVLIFFYLKLEKKKK